MRTELVTIPTDTIPLDGLYYEPDGEAGSRAAAGAALLFHGGLACLAFNRRGHDILSTRNSRAPEGGAYQTESEAIEDNRLAAKWLAGRGFTTPVVIGHSNGGMLAVRHVADHPHTPALVLLSAHMGGKNHIQRSSKLGLLAGDRIEEITAQARALVQAGRERELLVMPGWWYVISAESFLDRLTEAPDGLELAPKVTCPTLYIRGELEPRDHYPAEEFQRRVSGSCTVKIVPACDHFYNGREQAVQELVSSWLAETLNLARRKRRMQTGGRISPTAK